MERLLKTYACFVAVFFAVISAGAQVAPGEEIRDSSNVVSQKALATADSLRMAYDFSSALDYYQKAISSSSDSLFGVRAQSGLLLAQNGLNMTEYCCSPSVVAKRRFSIKDFFLYYPLENRSWRSIPNPLDSLASGVVNATYIPEGAKTLYYSASDALGIRDIYMTHCLDTAWSVPELINEQMTSTSNEIWPMLTPDGKSLYFSSEGLYGMGGYDLYVTNWDEENHDWGVPVNLGFPYSSPYNDYLFINTDDGKYSLFASDRECPGTDSVYVYVLEYDSMPVRRPVDSVKELRELATLTPAHDPTHIDNGSAVSEEMPENEDTRRYVAKITQVRALRDSIFAHEKRMDTERASISKTADATEKEARIARVMDMEMVLSKLQDSLTRASKELRTIEMDFLTKGVVIDIAEVQTTVEKEVVGSSSGYAFSKNKMGGRLKMNVLKPKPVFDYTFMILPEGRFAEDNTLPSGLVYQIQLFTSGTHADVKRLRGLSPVFEQRSASLRYTYYAGLFRSYKDCLQSLNKVKRAGFRDAFIVAFNNGSSIPVATARSMEDKIKVLWQVKIIPEGGSLSESAVSAIRQHTSADIARSMEDGSVVYIITPLNEKSDADALVDSLHALGIQNATALELH